MVKAGAWDESKHPRDQDGQFSSGGGGGGTTGPKKPKGPSAWERAKAIGLGAAALGGAVVAPAVVTRLAMPAIRRGVGRVLMPVSSRTPTSAQSRAQAAALRMSARRAREEARRPMSLAQALRAGSR